MSADPGIVVVGAGPTGLTLACELHRLGVPCRVIDSEQGPTRVSRALGMFTRSLEVLDDFGAAEEAISRGHRIEATSIYSEGRRVGGFATSSLSGTARPVILALPQYETELLLQRRLESLGGSVERDTALRELRQAPDRTGVALALDAPSGMRAASARWVVGADGAHSTVRKCLAIGFSGKATKAVFVIVDAHVERGPARGEVHYHFSPEGITVVVPLPDGSYRFAISMPEPIGDGSPVPLSGVQALLDRRVGNDIRILRLGDAGWGAAQVRVHARVADTFRLGRCLLAGDAAHVYSPIGGQGMNGGIQDAHNLAWKLALVSAGRAHESLLDSYTIERRAVAQAAVRTTSAQMRLGSIRLRPAAAVRDCLTALLSRTGALERRMAPESVQLRIAYRDSPATARAGLRRSAARGRRIADVPLEGCVPDGPALEGCVPEGPAREGCVPEGPAREGCVPEGPAREARAQGRVRLFDLARRQPFMLLALGLRERHLARLCELRRLTAESYGELVAVHRVVARVTGPDPAAAQGGAVLIDRESELHGHLRVRRPTLCLVRADAHIAFLGPLAADAALLAHLDRMLERAASWPAAHDEPGGARALRAGDAAGDAVRDAAGGRLTPPTSSPGDRSRQSSS